MLTIDVRYDRVTILGHTILRPSHISPSAWLAFWEAVMRLPLAS